MYCTNWIQAFIINYMCMHLIWFRHKIPHQCKIIKQTKVLLYSTSWNDSMLEFLKLPQLSLVSKELGLLLCANKQTSNSIILHYTS